MGLGLGLEARFTAVIGCQRDAAVGIGFSAILILAGTYP